MTADVDHALEGPSPQMETLEFPVPKPGAAKPSDLPSSALQAHPLRAGEVTAQLLLAAEAAASPPWACAPGCSIYVN